MRIFTKLTVARGCARHPRRHFVTFRVLADAVRRNRQWSATHLMPIRDRVNVAARRGVSSSSGRSGAIPVAMPSSVERPTEPSREVHQHHTRAATRFEPPPLVVEPTSSRDPDDWLDAVFRRDYAPLVRLATLLADREVAEELVQDAFVRTHGRLSRIAPGKVTVYLRSA